MAGRTPRRARGLYPKRTRSRTAAVVRSSLGTLELLSLAMVGCDSSSQLHHTYHPVSSSSSLSFLSSLGRGLYLSHVVLPLRAPLSPFSAVALHGPPSIPPQHPSFCREKKKGKKEKFSSPLLPRSLSFTAPAADWSSSRSRSWDPSPGLRAHESRRCVRDAGRSHPDGAAGDEHV